MDQISIKDALAFMDTGQIFSCKVVKYNMQKQEGGDVFDVDEAILLKAPQKKTSRTMTAAEKTELKKRTPNHRKWFTRNIVLCQNGHPMELFKRKIHPPLMIEFNGKTVVP